MNVQIIGQLVNPMYQPMAGNLIRATAEITRTTPLGAEAETITDSEGRYSFELVEGKYRIEIFSVDTLHKSGIVYIDGNTPNPINIMALLAYRPTPVIPEIIEGTPEWANLVSDLIEGDDTTTQLLESPVSDDVSVITDTKQVYSNERLDSSLARNTLLHETGNASVLNQDTVYSDGSLNEAAITGNKFSTRNTTGSDLLEVYEASDGSVSLNSTREIVTQDSSYKDNLVITGDELTKTTEHSLQGNGLTTSEVINENSLLASATKLLSLNNYTLKTKVVDDWKHSYTDENSAIVDKPKLERSTSTTLEGPLHNITFVDSQNALLNVNDEITSGSERSITAQDKKVYELQSNDGVTTEINKHADNYNIIDSEGNTVFNVNTETKEVTLSASLKIDNPEDFRGADGDTIFEVFEYSVDGLDWHTTYTITDLYRRFNTSMNGIVDTSNWSAAVLLQAQDGLPGDTLYIEYVYSSNLIEWHSEMVTGDIYRRERTVTNSLAGAWSTASRIAGYNGTEGYTTELEYQYAVNGLDASTAWHSNFITGDHFRRERLVIYASATDYDNNNPILPYAEWNNIVQIVPIAGQDYGIKQTSVFLFQRGNAKPNPPNAELTYNFLGLTLLPEVALNGWSTTIPDGEGNIYLALASATSLTDEDVIASSEWVISQWSAAAYNQTTINLYQRSTSSVIAPTTELTYNFENQSFVEPYDLEGWSTVIPTGDDELYTATSSAFSNETVDTILPTEWVVGGQGASGLNRHSLTIYQRKLTEPSPPSDSDYSFSTATLTGLDNNWSNTIPDGEGILWVGLATALSYGSTDVIGTNEWNISKLTEDGKTLATVNLYALSDTLPSVSFTTVTQTLATGEINITGPNIEGWQTSVPSNTEAGGIVWFISDVRLEFATDELSIHNADDFSPPVQFAVNGTNGIDGLPGADGIDGLDGIDGIEGESSYFHIAYADDIDGNGFSQSPLSKAYTGTYTDNLDTDSTDPSKYTWMRTLGADGDQGIPGDSGPKGEKGDKGDTGVTGSAGSDGVDGQTTYFHVAYADDAIGTGFNQDPLGKEYIGTYVDTTEADSSNVGLYTWVLIKGAQGEDGSQGIAGTNGANGQTSYLHIAYATNSTGSEGFSTSSSAGKTYIGQYTDFNATDSSDNTDYNWTLIKGDTGSTGATGPTGDQGEAGVDAISLVAAYISNFYNSDDGWTITNATATINPSYLNLVNVIGDAGVTQPNIYIDGAQNTLVVFRLRNNGPSFTSGVQCYYTTSSHGISGNYVKVMEDIYYPEGEWITITLDMSQLTQGGTDWVDSVIKNLRVDYVSNGDKDIDIDYIMVGRPGAANNLYTWIKYSESADGSNPVNSPTAATTYIGLAYNKTDPIESSDETEYTWTKFIGDQGVEGPAGNNGVSLYTWIKYSSNADGTDPVDSPIGKEYIGLAYNKTTATESSDKSLYTWSQYRGDDGTDGQTSYLHIAYADDESGNGFNQSPTGKAYIGIYVDFILADSTDPSLYEWSLIQGEAGIEGEAGKHGQGSVVVELTDETSIPDDAGKDAHVAGITERPAQDGDILTYQNEDGYTEFAYQYIRKDGAWIVFSLRIDGSAIINGTLAAEALMAETITGDKINTATTLRVGNLGIRNYDAAGTITVDTEGLTYIPDDLSSVGTTVTLDIPGHAIEVGDEINIEGMGDITQLGTTLLSDITSATANSPFFIEEGTRYVVITTTLTSTVYIYFLDLTTAYDLTTATLSSKVACPNVRGSSEPVYIRFSSDGTRLFVVEEMRIYQHELLTPYDVTTAVYNNVLIEYSTISAYSFMFNDTGDKLYITDFQDDIQEVILASPYQLQGYTPGTITNITTVLGADIKLRGFTDEGKYAYGVYTYYNNPASHLWMVALDAPYDMSTINPAKSRSYDISEILPTYFRLSGVSVNNSRATILTQDQTDTTHGNVLTYATDFSLESAILNKEHIVTGVSVDTIEFSVPSSLPAATYLSSGVVYLASGLGSLYGFTSVFGSGAITSPSDIITTIQSLYLDTLLGITTLVIDETEASNIEQITITLEDKTLTFSPTGSGAYTSTSLLFELGDVGKTYSFNLFGELIIPFSEEVLFINGDETTVGNADYRMWAGAEYPINAPFSIDKEGNLRAKNADLTGGVASIEGNFSGTITASDVKAGSSISGSHISSTYIVGGVIFGATVYAGNNLIAVDTDDNVNTYTYYDGYTASDPTPLPVSAEENINISLVDNTYTSPLFATKYFTFNGFTCAKDTKLPFTTQRSAYNRIPEGTFSIVSKSNTGTTSDTKAVYVTVETIDRATGDILSTSDTVRSGVYGLGKTNVETLTYKGLIFSISINSNLGIIIKNLESVYGTDDIYSHGYLRFKIKTAKENGSSSLVLTAKVTLDNTAPVAQ